MEKNRAKILVVDREPQLLDVMSEQLKLHGYEVLQASDGEMALKMHATNVIDVMIVDTDIEKISAFELCQKVLKQTQIPIIMLSNQYEVEQVVNGLYHGASDFMIKPFHLKELTARVYVQLRDKNVMRTSQQKVGLFEINESQYEIKYNGMILSLSPTEYNLLSYFILNHNLVLSKSKILDDVWGVDFFGEENVVEVYVRYLRNKLGDKQHDVIKTIRGAGYRLII